jgi:fructose-specific phosphotransferase system IIC component
VAALASRLGLTHNLQRMAKRSISGKAVVGFFLACTLADFILGYIRGRTMAAVVTHVLLGVLSTIVFFLIWWFSVGEDESGDRC